MLRSRSGSGSGMVFKEGGIYIFSFCLHGVPLKIHTRPFESCMDFLGKLAHSFSFLCVSYPLKIHTIFKGSGMHLFGEGTLLK